MFNNCMPLSMPCLVASCLALSFSLVHASGAYAESKRIALVIGISEYEAFGPLKQATTDAKAVGDALGGEAAGFVVTRLIDEPTPATVLRRKLDEFVASIERDDVVLIYYAGHGIQDGNANYLIPDDFPKSGTLKTHAINVNELLKRVAARAPQVKILVLDACRNNPLATNGPSGLAEMDSAAYGPNTHVEFAAGKGQTAKDGVFARHFAAELARKGANLDEVFRRVRDKVRADTSGAQTTYSSSQMTLNFFFVSVALPDAGSALATLERAAATLPLGDVGQTLAVESLINEKRSLAGTELLQGLSLVKGTFNAGDFSSARMTASDLSGASLRASDLSKANLSFTKLNGTIFDSTDSTCASAKGEPGGKGCTKLDGATLSFADASEAGLAGVHASDSNWFAVRGEGIRFAGAILQRASFMFADLKKAVFDGADLRGTFFIGSDLRGASFKGALLDNTDFTGAIVDSAALTRDQVSRACETPPPPFQPGQFAYAFSVLMIEVIPNTRFDGGFEYARFVDKQYPYDLLPNGLAKCKPRNLPDGAWYPIWQTRGEDQIRTDVAERFPQKLLQQAGRRAAVRTRIDDHFNALWKPPAR
jgi:uncharacterized protein YjbI with pentapeptide repeats